MKRLLLWASLGALLSYWAGLVLPAPPPCSDPAVRTLAGRFESALGSLTLSCRGQMLRDRDTFFWSLFTDHFGSHWAFFMQLRTTSHQGSIRKYY
eukprot:g27906.t1